jgi:hypothetical protein
MIVVPLIIIIIISASLWYVLSRDTNPNRGRADKAVVDEILRYHHIERAEDDA